MKKLLALVLSLSLILALGACSSKQEPTTESSQPVKSESSPAEKMKITVSIASFDNTFASFIMSRMKVFNEEHPELEITYLDSANDAATQISNIENAVINGAQAVICQPVDAKQTQPIITSCKDAGIPLIAFNRRFEGCDTFVGADNAKAGSLMAERCGELLKGTGKIALVQGIMGQANTYERTDAIKATLAEKFPDIKIVQEGASDWKRDKALELVETWLQSGTTFDAIICLNDDSGLGAQMALAAAGLADKIPVLSINGDPSGIKGVKEGVLDCTAFQGPFDQADKALEIAMEYIKGGAPTKEFLVEYKLITKDNVEDYMKFTAVN